MSGNNVSHANNKNRRKFLPNLCNVTLLSETLGQSIRFVSGLRAGTCGRLNTVAALDAFLAKARDNELSQKARLLKRQVQKETGRSCG